MVIHNQSSVSDQVIGLRIKYRREEIGIKQEALAQLLGLSQETLSDYETGKTGIYADVLFLVAKLLKVDVDYFYDGLSNYTEFDLQKMREVDNIKRTFVLKRLAKNSFRKNEHYETVKQFIKAFSKR